MKKLVSIIDLDLILNLALVFLASWALIWALVYN